MEPKKLLILRILKILTDYSDADHKLTQQDIIERLYKDYAIECERKAVGRNIAYLKEAGYVIEGDKNGVYLDERLFEISELRMLIDSVLSSRYIDKKHSEDLIKKLLDLGGKYFKDSTHHLYFNKSWTKSDNTTVFLNIEILNEAIDKGLQVSFVYNRYNEKKALVPTSETPFLVNPYQLLLHNQRYYLVCNPDGRDDIWYLRLDRMTEPTLTQTDSKPLKAVTGCENGLKLSQIDERLPYMFGGKMEKITLSCDKSIINDLIDWFGKDVIIKDGQDGKITVELQSNAEGMLYWALQYGNYVEILSPNRLRENVKQSIIKMYNTYNC